MLAVFCLALPDELPAEVPATHVELRVVGGPAAGGLRGWLEVTPAGGGPGSDEVPRKVPFELGADGRTSLDLPGPGRSLWRLRPRLPGFWGPEKVVASGEAAASLLLFPTARVTAKLRFPPGHERRGDLRLSFVPVPESRLAPAGGPLPEGAVDCPADSEGVLRCEVPAGHLDLSLHREGYASVHVWAAELAAGGLADLGELVLVPGASVTGSVVVEGGRRVADEVRVELLPATAGRPGPLGETRTGELRRVVTPDERGFFQLADVAPGAWLVRVTGPGYAAAERGPLTVFEGRETDLGEPIRLAPPAVLQVWIRPPVDPAGGRWRLHLQPADDGGELTAVDGEADFGGFFRRRGPAPGRYRLLLEDGGESRWLEREIEVEAGMEPVSLEIPLLRVVGQVTLGGEAVRARISFGGLRGERQVVLYADRNGRFSGALPGPGRWPVAVRLRWPGAEQMLEPVDIQPEDDGIARVELEIPDTGLEGRVVTGEGKPVAEAAVRAWRRGDEPLGNSEDTTDEKGRFLFRGLPAGCTTISVLHPHLSGDPVEAEVREGERGETVEIVLEDQVVVRGRVISSRGAVTGAEIEAWPELPTARRLPLERAVSDPTGSFEVGLPRSATAALLVVLPPGHAARVLRVPLPCSSGLEIPVADFGGTLLLDLPASTGGAGGSTLAHGGWAPWLSLFRAWAAFHGEPAPPSGRWILPMMEIGDYALCAPDGVRCDAGTLIPGGELELALPTRPKDAARNTEVGLSKTPTP